VYKLPWRQSLFILVCYYNPLEKGLDFLQILKRAGKDAFDIQPIEPSASDSTPQTSLNFPLSKILWRFATNSFRVAPLVATEFAKIQLVKTR